MQLLTTEEAQASLDHMFPDHPMTIHPGMEPVVSWLVALEDRVQGSGPNERMHLAIETISDFVGEPNTIEKIAEYADADPAQVDVIIAALVRAMQELG